MIGTYVNQRKWLAEKVDAMVKRRQDLTGQPYDLLVGTPESPHYHRWYVVESKHQIKDPHAVEGHDAKGFEKYKNNRAPLWKVYLHHFIGDDNDPILHDHRYANLSWLMFGNYMEEQFFGDPKKWIEADNGLPITRRVHRQQNGVYFRGPRTPHRIEMYRGKDNEDILDCWSLFLCGPSIRQWGFWCPSGWKPWPKIVDFENYGLKGNSQMGRGCEE